jgi:hypothetical protein
MRQVSLICTNQEGLGAHRGTSLHKKINHCLAPMREDLKTKILEKLHLCMVRWGNHCSLCSSQIRPLLTKVAIGSCHVDEDQIAEGLVMGITIGTIG